MQKEGCSFLKKRTKKLLQIWLRPLRRGSAQDSKVFCFFFSKKKSFLALLSLLLPAATLPLGPPDKSKYAAFDPATHHLFVAQGAAITVVDTSSMTIAGRIGGLPGAHGIALVPGGSGYAAGGKSASVAVFDPATLKTIATIKAGEDANAVVYDPASRHVFVMNDDAATITVIDPARNASMATITLPPGEGLEGAAADGAGHLFVAHSAAGDVLRIDTRRGRVDASFKLHDCAKPQGLALDPQSGRVFVSCENRELLVLDGRDGKSLATIPIGPGNRTLIFDARRRRVYAPCADGTITVIDAGDLGSTGMRAPLVAAPGLRTAALDARSGRLYLVGAADGGLSVSVLDPPP
jgi:DNA-binding beta-propeller fold protein YncE